jgi:hypothetical protein
MCVILFINLNILKFSSYFILHLFQCFKFSFFLVVYLLCLPEICSVAVGKHYNILLNYYYYYYYGLLFGLIDHLISNIKILF